MEREPYAPRPCASVSCRPASAPPFLFLPRRSLFLPRDVRFKQVRRAEKRSGSSTGEGWRKEAGFDAAAKAASILKVKRRADKQLDTLLSQVVCCAWTGVRVG